VTELGIGADDRKATGIGTKGLLSAEPIFRIVSDELSRKVAKALWFELLVAERRNRAHPGCAAGRKEARYEHNANQEQGNNGEACRIGVAYATPLSTGSIPAKLKNQLKRNSLPESVAPLACAWAHLPV
jgi:hypothetical protein